MLGRLNLTAGARGTSSPLTFIPPPCVNYVPAIPFFYAWLPGEIHGSMIELDKVVAREVNNVHISDRYANIFILFKKYS